MTLPSPLAATTNRLSISLDTLGEEQRADEGTIGRQISYNSSVDSKANQSNESETWHDAKLWKDDFSH